MITEAHKGISVVIPTTGRATLVQAIQSVRSQTYGKIELIVVLDNPKLRSFVENLLVLSSEILLVTKGNEGGGVARQIGTDKAQYPHIAYLDDDDFWDPDKLRLQHLAMTLANSDWSFTASNFLTRNGRVKVFPRERPPSITASLPDYIAQRKSILFGDSLVQSSSLMIKREAIKELPWNTNLLKHQDWDLVFRLCTRKFRFSFLAQPLVTVRQGSPSSVSSISNWQASLEWYEVVKKYLGKTAQADFLLLHVVAPLIIEGRNARALRELRFAIALRPHLAALIVSFAKVASCLLRNR